jgi:CheY-like chemotaxis protein
LLILYLEDNVNDANLIRRYINTTSHHLTVVTTPDEASTLVREQPFDLILVDVMLGQERGGSDFAQDLREHQYTGALIGVTALTAPQDMKRYREIGFDSVLSKPFTILELAKLLEHYLA